MENTDNRMEKVPEIDHKSIHQYEKANVKNVQDDAGEDLWKIKSSIEKLSKQVSYSDCFDYNDVASVKSNQRVLKRKQEQQTNLTKLHDEPYFAHVVYTVQSANGTDSPQRKNLYISKHEPKFQKQYTDGNGESFEIRRWTNPEINFYYAKEKEYLTNDGHFEFQQKIYHIEKLRRINLNRGNLVNCPLTIENGVSLTQGKDEDPQFNMILEQRRNQTELTDITETIRSQQNAVILRPARENFIVQGCAGSGKTVVMLHRLSRLQANGQLSAFEKVYILTPNREFGKYLSFVQNSLGLDTEKIHMLPTEDFYLKLVQAYNEQLIELPDFRENYQVSNLDLKDESALEQEMLKHIYSESFFNQIKTAFQSASRAAYKSCPLVFRTFHEESPETAGAVYAVLKKGEKLTGLPEFKAVKSKQLTVMRLEKRIRKKQEEQERLHDRMNQAAQAVLTRLEQYQNCLTSSNVPELLQLLLSEQRAVQMRSKKYRKQIDQLLNRRYAFVDKARKQSGTAYSGIRERELQADQTEMNTFIQTRAQDVLREAFFSGEQSFQEIHDNAAKQLENNLFLPILQKLLFILIQKFTLEDVDAELQDLKTNQQLSETELFHRLSAGLPERIAQMKEAMEEGRISYLPKFLLLGQIPAAGLSSDLFGSASQAVLKLSGMEIDDDLTQLESEKQFLKENTEILLNKIDFAEGTEVFDAQAFEQQQKRLLRIWDWSALFKTLFIGQLPEKLQPLVSLNQIRYRFNLAYLLFAQSLYFGALQGKEMMINIDEAQDLPLGEYRFLQAALGQDTVFNLYGDDAQSIYGYRGLDSWKKLLKSNSRLQMYELNENYRNPYEITMYCNRLFGLDLKPSGEKGTGAQEAGEYSLDEALHQLEARIHEFSPCRSVIITARKNHLNVVQAKVHSHPLLSSELEHGSLELLSVKDAKGREFQHAVVVFDHMSTQERYVACTRALKTLIVCHHPFWTGAKKQVYADWPVPLDEERIFAWMEKQGIQDADPAAPFNEAEPDKEEEFLSEESLSEESILEELTDFDQDEETEEADDSVILGGFTLKKDEEEKAVFEAPLAVPFEEAEEQAASVAPASFDQPNKSSERPEPFIQELVEMQPELNVLAHQPADSDEPESAEPEKNSFEEQPELRQTDKSSFALDRTDQAAPNDEPVFPHDAEKQNEPAAVSVPHRRSGWKGFLSKVLGTANTSGKQSLDAEESRSANPGHSVTDAVRQQTEPNRQEIESGSESAAGASVMVQEQAVEVSLNQAEQQVSQNPAAVVSPKQPAELPAEAESSAEENSAMQDKEGVPVPESAEMKDEKTQLADPAQQNGLTDEIRTQILEAARAAAEEAAMMTARKYVSEQMQQIQAGLCEIAADLQRSIVRMASDLEETSQKTQTQLCSMEKTIGRLSSLIGSHQPETVSGNEKPE